MTVGSPWSIPSDLSPQSATAQPSDTEMTVATIDTASSNGRSRWPYAVSMSAYEPAWISVTHVLMSNVPVPPPETSSPPTSACASSSKRMAVSVCSTRVARSATPTAWPSYPMTPRTVRPRARAVSASRPACSGGQPQRGMPTNTSITTSRRPARAAASIVASESTAIVMRASRAARRCSRSGSTTSFARSRSSPSPAFAMPSISLGVAHVKVRWPRAACSRASAVVLCAFTCGRQRSPGSAAAIAARLCSKAPVSTTSAGVGRSCTVVMRMRALQNGDVARGPPARRGRLPHRGPSTAPAARLSDPGLAMGRGARRVARAGRRLRRGASRVQASHRPVPALARRTGVARRRPLHGDRRRRPRRAVQVPAPSRRHRRGHQRRRPDARALPHLEGGPPGGQLSEHVADAGAEPVERAGQDARDLHLTHAEAVGDLGLCEPVVEAQHDDVALAGRERVEQLRHDHPPLDGLDPAVDVPVAVDDPAPAGLPVLVLDGRGNDGAPALGIETLDRLEQADERDLEEIVVAFATPAEAPRDRFGEPDVHLDEPVPQPAVLGAAILDEQRRPLLRVGRHVSDAVRA